MKFIYFSNKLPYDDLRTLFRELLQHSKSRQYPVVARFLELSTLAIREEIQALPADLKALIPPFETVLNFADFDDIAKGPLSASIDAILLCLVELGTFIGYHEASPVAFSFNVTDTALAGLGYGSLAQVAVSVSPTLSDLADAGAEVVRQVFRLGVLIHEVSQNLQPRDPSHHGPPDTWAYLLADVDADKVQEELDGFHEAEKTPEASKIFISAINVTSVAISGPPARLKSLFRTADFFRDAKSIALPVFGGLCHAPHIYTWENVHDIVRTPSMALLDAKLAPRIPIYSTNTGRPFAVKTATELFEAVFHELLTQPYQWSLVIEGIAGQIRDIGASQCQVVVFRVALQDNELVNALKKTPKLQVTVEELIPWVHTQNTDTDPPRGPSQAKIAIVGMSCRMPGADSTEEFWKLLESGLDMAREIPADRFDVKTHYDPAGKRTNTSHTPYGCFIEEPGLFDAPFFNMSPREAEQTDPMQRLALVTAYEALERAGYVANRTAATQMERIGTFYGQASDDYREVNTGQEISTYYIPGGCRAFGPGRINYFFKFAGPSYSIDTACSSSLATIQAACTSLWNGDTDTVVAGGMNVLTNSDVFAGLSHGHFLSKTPGACKTWDSQADGYCRADAVASVVMKRLADAEADNDNILGVILGAATNHSAQAISITHPHAGHQSFLSRLVLSRAGVDPLAVGFVEMHGTGTQAGDGEEIKSVTDVFAPNGSCSREAGNPLYIGAVKANVGHSEAAAGVAGLVKALLVLQKGAIPPHVGIKNSLTPKFPDDIGGRNVCIPFQKIEWPHVTGKKRFVVVNNFGAAGGNTTIALEEAPECRVVDIRMRSARSSHVIAVSAKSKASLRGNLERLHAYLDQNGDQVSVADLGYSTTARRMHYNHRIAFSASTIAQVNRQLKLALASVDSHKPIPSGVSPVAFVFTGQGASYKSYNLELFHDTPYYRAQIIHLDTIAQGQGFSSFIPAIDGSHPTDYGHSPVITQLALVCTEIALAKYWGSLGIKADVVIGHSLGEYAALYVAGVLSAADAVFLAGTRARLLEQKCQPGSHKMIAVRAPLAHIEKIAAETGALFEVACINGPKDTVLSGPAAEMDNLVPLLEADGAKCITLDVTFAFHSAQTDPILEDFEAIAATGVFFQPPQLPVISPLLGRVVFDDRTFDANYVRRATREPVNFLAALQAAHDIGTIDEDTIWIEIGPHPVGVAFAKSTLGAVNLAVPSLRRGEDNWTTMANSLSTLHCAGVNISWNEFHKPFQSALRLLDLPTYAWNNKTYWLQYKGDWALTKGNDYYDEKKTAGKGATLPASSFSTSSVQQIVEESFHGSAGTVVMQSDVSQRDFREAAWGHKMNNCGVVTSSIHADIAYTLGDYLYRKLRPGTQQVSMDFKNLDVLRGLVTHNDTQTRQFFRVTVHTDDIRVNTAELIWQRVDDTGSPIDEPFASATLQYDDPETWLTSWARYSHLIDGRIADLTRLAETGSTASRFSHAFAYRLFASSLVDYSPKYRGMQSVVMAGLEAFADVTLVAGSHAGPGIWTVPPHFIDSVVHLAGFVMNVSDAVDNRTGFCVTPGWKSMRFARPLIPGGTYRSYVKMIASLEDPTVYLGDVYVLQEGEIMGLVEGIQFRRYPRILLGRFFSAPDDPYAPPIAASPLTKKDSQVSTNASKMSMPSLVASSHAPAINNVNGIDGTYGINGINDTSTNTTSATATPITTSLNGTYTSDKAVRIISGETGLDIADLIDDATFADLGVDSLMSLVIVEKFREQLGVVVDGSLFLEYPTIGALRSWLDK